MGNNIALNVPRFCPLVLLTKSNIKTQMSVGHLMQLAEGGKPKHID